MMKHSALILLAALTLGLDACSKSDSWSLKGTAPAGVDSVFVMAPTLTGGWYALDSAKVDSKGNYSMTLPRANGEIFRVDLGAKSVYLTADSTEALTLDSLGIRGGSVEAELFNAVDSAIAAGADAKEVLRALNGNYASKAAYYATRLMRNRRLLQTVTNRYVEEQPGNPLTAVLTAELQKMLPKAQSSGEQTVLLADEIGYYDVTLMDRNGQMQSLSDLVNANPLVVLAYADFTTPNVQAVTLALGEAQSAGAAIYEIGFGENQHQWAAASEGIPWVSVYQSDAADKTHIRQYAVAEFPTYFVIRNGEVVARASNAEELKKSL